MFWAACGPPAAPSIAPAPAPSTALRDASSERPWTLTVETVTSGSRLHVASVGIVVERDSHERVWRGYYVKKRFAHRGGGGGRSVVCSRDGEVPASVVTELDRRMRTLAVSDHERRGGGLGSTMVRLERDDDRLKTLIKCDLMVATPADDNTLCGLAQTVVSQYRSNACADPAASPACTRSFVKTDQPPPRRITDKRATALEEAQEGRRSKLLSDDDCAI